MTIAVPSGEDNFTRCHYEALRRVSTQSKGKKVKVGFFYSATYSGNAATSRAVQS